MLNLLYGWNRMDLYTVFLPLIHTSHPLHFYKAKWRHHPTNTHTPLCHLSVQRPMSFCTGSSWGAKRAKSRKVSLGSRVSNPTSFRLSPPPRCCLSNGPATLLCLPTGSPPPSWCPLHTFTATSARFVH